MPVKCNIFLLAKIPNLSNVISWMFESIACYFCHNSSGERKENFACHSGTVVFFFFFFFFFFLLFGDIIPTLHIDFFNPSLFGTYFYLCSHYIFKVA